jgi:transcriptional regulator with XRE-family HTH domain
LHNFREEDDMHTFGELLKGFRQREGLSQQELGYVVKRGRTTISAWERSLYLPDTRDVVLALEDALNLSHAETDRLLFAAQYPLEYGTSEPELTPMARVEEAHVERMVVEQLEVTDAPQRLPTPLRTRIPEPRASHLVGREDELKWVCERLKAK